MKEDDRRIAMSVTGAAFLAAVFLVALVGDMANKAGGANEIALRVIQWGFVPFFFGGMMYRAWKPVQPDR